MLRNTIMWLASITGLLASCIAFAHHGVSTKFDSASSMTLKGRVIRLDWANPHAHVFMLVEDGGESLPWYVELESPQLLTVNGWDADALKPGDAITVQGFPARDDSRQVWGDSIVLDSTGQVVLDTGIPDLSAVARDTKSRPTPRWEDGTPLLGAPPGEAGYWIADTTVLIEDGVDVAMAANGQLRDISEAAEVAPLQEWALRLYERRQRNFLRSDPTWLECRPPAGPRKFLTEFGIQLLEDKPLQRIFVIAGGGNNDWHLIHTDGRELNGDFGLDDGNLLYYGRNVGTWENDTFVIRSEGYNEKFWLPGGLPHSDLMKITERLTRPDFNTLTYEVTIDDPGTYTRPWTSGWTLHWLEGRNPPEHYCQDNRL